MLQKVHALIVFYCFICAGRVAMGNEENIRKDSFTDAITSSFYIDKTQFIEEVLNLPNVSYITMPRSFGRTTNLHMLKHYFEIEYFKNGTGMNKNKTQSHKLFTSVHHGKPLAFYVNKDRFYKHFGKYPVIDLNFVDLLAGPLDSSLMVTIAEIYSAHEYLKDSSSLTSHEMEVFSSVANFSAPIDQDVLMKSLSILCSFLLKHWKEKCVIIIDEYDTVISELVRFDADEEEFQISVEFLGKFISESVAFNNFLYKSVLVGSTFLGEVLSRSASSIVPLKFILGGKLGSSFGFTHSEVLYLANKKQYKDTNGLEKQFGGYKVEGLKECLFNTQSIIDVVVHGKSLAGNWGSVTRLDGLKAMFTTKNIGKEVKDMLSGIPVQIKLLKAVGIADIIHLKECYALRESGKALEEEKRRFLQFLFEDGFLTLHERIDKDTVSVSLPNLETRKIFSDVLTLATGDEFGIKHEKTELYSEAMKKLNGSKESMDSLHRGLNTMFRGAKIKPKTEEELEHTLFAYLNDIKIFVDVKSGVHTKSGGRLNLLVTRIDGVGVLLKLKFNAGNSLEPLDAILKTHQYTYFDNEDVLQRVTKQIYVGVACHVKEKEMEFDLSHICSEPKKC